MRFVVLGATGGTGREVVRQALGEGHEVVAFVRRPEALEPQPGLTVVGGTLDDVAGLTDALDSADALICCIGPRDPRAFVRGDVIARAVDTAIAAMNSAGVRRLVVMSALGAGDTAEVTPTAIKLPARTFMRATYADKEKAEQRLQEADLDARIVYPVILTSGSATGTARLLPISGDLRMGRLPRVARADVATLLLQLAQDDQPQDTRFVVA